MISVESRAQYGRCRRASYSLTVLLLRSFRGALQGAARQKTARKLIIGTAARDDERLSYVGNSFVCAVGPGRWRRPARSQSVLRKPIANDFNEATAFCKAPTCVNRAPGFSLHKRAVFVGVRPVWIAGIKDLAAKNTLPVPARLP
jgi:hypothetical protein